MNLCNVSEAYVTSFQNLVRKFVSFYANYSRFLVSGGIIQMDSEVSRQGICHLRGFAATRAADRGSGIMRTTQR